MGTQDQIARTVVELSECGTILRIAGGDVGALREFYGRQGARVHGLARRFLGDAHEAEEATQDVFVRVWQRARDYDARRASPWAWVAMMTRSACIDRLRRRRVRCEVSGTCDPETDVLRVVAYDDHGVERFPRAEHADLADLFDFLRPAERECLLRVFFDGLSQSETAERTGLPLGTVKTHLRRGLERLRKTLSSHDS